MASNNKIELKLKPSSVIKTNLGIQPNGKVHAFFTETCYNHMNKYTPYATGNLAEDSVVVTTDEIIYNAPYSHYMYEGKVMGPNIPIKDKAGNIIGWFSKKPKYYTGADIVYNKSMHDKATSHWDKKMWSAEKNQVISEVEDYMKKHGGK